MLDLSVRGLALSDLIETACDEASEWARKWRAAGKESWQTNSITSTLFGSDSDSRSSWLWERRARSSVVLEFARAMA